METLDRENVSISLAFPVIESTRRAINNIPPCTRNERLVSFRFLRTSKQLIDKVITGRPHNV